MGEVTGFGQAEHAAGTVKNQQPGRSANRDRSQIDQKRCPGKARNGRRSGPGRTGPDGRGGQEQRSDPDNRAEAEIADLFRVRSSIESPMFITAAIDEDRGKAIGPRTSFRLRLRMMFAPTEMKLEYIGQRASWEA